MTQMWKMKGTYIFHAPVDMTKYNITDYYDVIKTPMDFGTIKLQLNTYYYKKANQFYNNMKL